MSRTIGAVDLNPRHNRSDRGKKRKFYAGKKVKGKRKIAFEKRIGNKTHLKIWVWERKAMSRDGRLRWNKYCRSHVKPEVTKFLMRHDVPVQDINTKQKIERFMEENYWEGTFLIMGFSNASNKYRCKPVKLCRVLVRESQNGLRAKLISNYRLSRYWFWRK
jgi:hypothetical protein